MVVVGRNAHILGETGRTANVFLFTTAYSALQDVPIVDAAIAYDCSFTGKNYVLICQNALSIPSMKHNLIPPFIMREANVVVNECPKIQQKNPVVEDHSIWFPGASFRIPLSLRGIFSYFLTRKLTRDKMQSCDNVLVMTPQSHAWNPHLDMYARNEENMLNWEGNMLESHH